MSNSKSRSRRCSSRSNSNQYETLEPRMLLACDVSVGNLGSGVAISDDATGLGYMMYSEQDVHTRFSGIQAANADHFIAVQLDGVQWQYNNDSAWVDFTPDISDRLMTEVFFNSGRSSQSGGLPVEGIPFGVSDDLWFAGNQFGGADSDGDFEVLGTCIDVLQNVDIDFVTRSQRLRQISVAAFHYESVHREIPDLALFNEDGHPLLSWRVELLPFLGLQDLYEQFHLDEPWDSPHNLSLLDDMPVVFQSPDVEGPRTPFVAVGGQSTLFPLWSENVSLGQISDGSQNTVMFVESLADRAVEWTRPRDLYFNPANPLDGVGELIAMADGSVEVLPSTITPENFANMLNRYDGNFVDMSVLDQPYNAERSLRDLAYAALNYESGYQRFPAHAIYTDDGATPLLSWRVNLLPFLGHNNLYEMFHLDEPWDSAHNLSLLPMMPQIYANPAIPAGMTSLLAVSGEGTMFPIQDRGLANAFTDNAALFVEADVDRAVEWTRPSDLLFDAANPQQGVGGIEGDGFNLATNHGETFFVPSTEPDANVAALMQIYDGQFVDFGQIQPFGDIKNNLRQMALAALNYESAYQEFPSHARYSSDGTTPLLSWRVSILPFIGANNLYDMFNHNEPWDSPHNLSLLPLMPRVFASPGSDWDSGFTSYLAITGEGTMFPIEDDGVGFGNVTDGTHNTILFVHANDSEAVEWTKPVDLIFDAANPRNGIDNTVSSGFNAVFVDGSVGFVNNTVDDDVVAQMIQIRDGIAFDEDWRALEYRYGRNGQQQNNLRQIALASLNYESAYMRFPAHAIYSPSTSEGTPMLSWRVAILPFLEHNNLYDQFNLDEPWDSEHNLSLLPLMPDVFSHPNLEDGMTVVQAVTGPGTIFPISHRGIGFGAITDGSSNTLLFVEADLDQAVPWTSPQDLYYDDADPSTDISDDIGTAHFGAISNFARADGSVDALSDCVSPEHIRRLVLRADGEIAQEDDLCHEGIVTPIGPGAQSVGLGKLNSGIAGPDDEYDIAYIMHSVENVFQRFADYPPFSGNSEQMVMVKYERTEGWLYHDNIAWRPFESQSGDRIIAAVTPINDQIYSAQGQIGSYRGMAVGFESGDLTFASHQWGGSPNTGEYQIFGSQFSVATDESLTTNVGDLKSGIAVDDAATGTGFLMYSAMNIHDRFGGTVFSFNSDHMIAVRNTAAGWQFNSNQAWIDFEPMAGDRLLAEANFSADTVKSLYGAAGYYEGIPKGFTKGDLLFVADQWEGTSNDGELQVIGTYFGAEDSVNAGELAAGIAVDDDATGTGYIMYSESMIATRFPAAFGASANHFIAVRYHADTWQFNTNFEWVSFTPEAGDRLMAFVDYSADTAMSLKGVSGIHEGITVGFDRGDLEFFANQWNGTFNEGEFQVVGSHFVENHPTRFDNGSGAGIAVSDDASGSGYIMYSATNLFDRFPDMFSGNVDHMIAVRYSVNKWEYNNNYEWIEFTPEAGDQLVARVNFSSGLITTLESSDFSTAGIKQGFLKGDLTFHANSWNGSPNQGEYEVRGTYFTDGHLAGFNGLTGHGSIAVDDDVTGNGVILHLETDVHTRFPDVFSASSSNFIVARFNRSTYQWQYNTNLEWVDFEIDGSERVLVEIDFSSKTINPVEESSGLYWGVPKGFEGDDINFHYDQWFGNYNAGEFEVTGSFFLT